MCISPYFDLIVDSIESMPTVEIDSTFKSLEPYVICIPIIIYKNLGIPFGILGSLPKSASLYSMLFESLKELDKNSLLISLKNNVLRFWESYLSFDLLMEVCYGIHVVCDSI